MAISAMRRRVRSNLKIALLLFSVVAAGLLGAVVMNALSFIRDNGQRAAFAAAPICSAADAARATTTALDCRVDLQAVTLESSVTTSSSSSPLDLQFDDNSTMTAQLRSQDDLSAFRAATETVTATVWRGQVVTVDLAGRPLQTKANPGPSTSQDLVVAGICLGLALLSGLAAYGSWREIRRQGALRSSTAEFTAPATGPPSGYGAPSDTWGGRPTQPGYHPQGLDALPAPAASPSASSRTQPGPGYRRATPDSGPGPAPGQPGGPTWERH